MTTRVTITASIELRDPSPAVVQHFAKGLYERLPAPGAGRLDIGSVSINVDPADED